MNIKRYQVTYADVYDLIVEIDHDIMTDEKLHEINRFWSDAAGRLADCNGNVTWAVLGLLGPLCFQLALEVFSVPEAFNWGKDKSGQEGWPRMDGSEGIKIISCDAPEFDDLDIEEVPLP